MMAANSYSPITDLELPTCRSLRPTPTPLDSSETLRSRGRVRRARLMSVGRISPRSAAHVDASGTSTPDSPATVQLPLPACTGEPALHCSCSWSERLVDLRRAPATCHDTPRLAGALWCRGAEPCHTPATIAPGAYLRRKAVAHVRTSQATPPY